MCIIFFGKNKEGLFVAFNRDEYLNRDTCRLAQIEQSSNLNFSQDIYYCLDVPTGGTFFAINKKTFNFCFLLNHAFPSHVYLANVKHKRGEIPLQYCSLPVLKDKDSILPNLETYIESSKEYFFNLAKIDEEYNGYNVICGNLYFEKVYYYTNNKEFYKTSELKLELPYEFDFTKELAYGVSNNALFEKLNKVDFGVKLFKNTLDNFNEKFELENFYQQVSKIMFDDLKYGEMPSILIDLLSKYSSTKNSNEIVNFEVNKIVDVKLYTNSSIFVRDNYENKFFYKFGTRQNYFLQYVNEVNKSKGNF